MAHALTLLLFACYCNIAYAQGSNVNNITTIAGKATYGFSGDGELAVNAQLKAPFRICQHNTYTYICDAFNHRIRQIDGATGIIKTIAGKNGSGYSGDGIQATNTTLNVPQGVSTDNDGNVYIADAGNSRIRKVDILTGIITTICGTGTHGNNGDGGPASNAQINRPTGIHVDKAGNIYIADWGNQKVRKISYSTGIITTIAGSSSGGYSGDGGLATDAKLNGPAQVATDIAGNIFISEQYNHTIRKIDVSSGVITTIAGNGFSGYWGDGELATNAKLNEPSGLIVDNANNIFVAEYGNGTVRKIDAVTGKISTFAGTGSIGFSGDNGPATNATLFCSDVSFDNHNDLIISDYENNRIRKVTIAANIVNSIDKEIVNKLFPSPTKGQFTIQTPTNSSLISIYNISGQKVYEHASTTNKTEIDISNQASGIYMVYVQCGDKQYVSKVVKE